MGDQREQAAQECKAGHGGLRPVGSVESSRGLKGSGRLDEDMAQDK